MKLPDRVVQRWDFFRRINPEFTDSSWLGAFFSVFAIAVMIALFVFELSSWMQVGQTTLVQLDTTGIDTFRMNFNVTFPSLPCQFLSVDVTDVLGTNRVNLTHNIHKWRTQIKPGVVEQMVRDNRPLPADTDEKRRAVLTQLAVQSENNFAAALDPLAGQNHRVYNVDMMKSIATLVNKHPIVFMSFVAPWCPYSRALTPVWKHSAEALKDKPYGELVAFASVDCTAMLGQFVCAQYHIHAFPTLAVFENFDGKSEGAKAHSHKIHLYTGSRDTAAIMSEAERILTEALPEWRSIDELSRDSVIAAARPTEGGIKFNAAGDVPLEGCQLHGILDLRRVPSEVHITGHEVPGFSFNTSAMNTTHILHHLSFGHHLLSSDQGVSGARLLAELLARGHSPVNLNLVQRPYVMETTNGTWEHFLKVVPEIYRMRTVRGEHPTYQYTSNSRQVANRKDVPEVLIGFDISPMAIIVEDEAIPFYHFLTSVCAIIGGIFTVIGFIDSITFHGLKSLKAKIELGKQT